MDKVLSFTLWTPEQADAFRNASTVFYESVWLPLQVPSWTVWQSSLQHAWADSQEALVSLFSFWLLTLRPVVFFIYMVVQYVLRMFWKYVIVQGMSQQGVQYMTALSRRIWRYQRSLTPREVAIELGILAGFVALYQIRKLLQRQAYFQRIAAFNRKQVHRVTSSYRRSKQAISTVGHRVLHEWSFFALASLLERYRLRWSPWWWQ
jgi:hypothetical protein